MCNYVVNSITFSSRNRSLLKELHKEVLECYDAAAKGKNLVKDLMKANGYPFPFWVNNTDHISACDEFITSKKCLSFFRCETTSAWGDNMAAFVKMLVEKYDNKINLSFCSEGMGNEVLLVKDETGVFYPERFKLEWCLDGDSDITYFNSFRSLFEYLKEKFPKARFGYYDTLENIKKSIDRAYEDVNEEYFVTINRFKEYQKEYDGYITLREAA